MDIEFLSTFPLRGTSEDVRGNVTGRSISIHVPLAGNVMLSVRFIPSRVIFLSTFPLRGTSAG